MKTEGQVRHKLQQVTFRHLQRTVRTALSCRPENCIHNGSVNLPTGEVHFCKLLQDPSGGNLPCDDAFGGLLQASRCSEFSLKNTKEKVQEEFTEFLKTSDVATIATRYPDLAALLWAIDAPTPSVPHVDPDPPAPVTQLPPPVTMLYIQPDGGALTYTLPSPGFTGHYRVVVFPSPVSSGGTP